VPAILAAADAPVVYTAEQSCYPDPGVAALYPEPPIGNLKYVNSGGIVGRAADLLEAITIMSRYDAVPTTCDQRASTKYFLEHPGLITLDYKQVSSACDRKVVNIITHTIRCTMMWHCCRHAGLAWLSVAQLCSYMAVQATMTERTQIAACVRGCRSAAAVVAAIASHYSHYCYYLIGTTVWLITAPTFLNTVLYTTKQEIFVTLAMNTSPVQFSPDGWITMADTGATPAALHANANWGKVMWPKLTAAWQTANDGTGTHTTAEPPAYFAGIAHAKAGNIPGAIAAFRQVVAEEPQNVVAIYNLGTLLHSSDRAAAQALYEQAVAVDAAHADSLHNLAIMLYEEGKGSEALALLQRAYDSDATAARRSTLDAVRGAIARGDAVNVVVKQ
jgi:Tetratricopeptide repeat